MVLLGGAGSAAGACGAGCSWSSLFFLRNHGRGKCVLLVVRAHERLPDLRSAGAQLVSGERTRHTNASLLRVATAQEDAGKA